MPEPDGAAYLHRPFLRMEFPCCDIQEGCLARTVIPDDADFFAALEDIPEMFKNRSTSPGKIHVMDLEYLLTHALTFHL